MARATALNMPSMTWWVFSPASWRMCSVTPALAGEGDEELLRQRGIEGAHHHRRHIGVPVQLAAPRDVHSRHDEGLVHGHGDVAEAADAALVAERLRERLPHDDARVLHRVMTVHLKVALAAHLQVEQAVAARTR